MMNAYLLIAAPPRRISRFLFRSFASLSPWRETLWGYRGSLAIISWTMCLAPKTSPVIHST